jgi:hypothetical protein
MFEAEVRHMIAEREEEMVVAVMARAEKLARFGDEVGHRFLNLWAHGEGVFAVGDHVDLVVNGLARRCQVDGAVIFAGNYGRIHEQIERDGLE